MPTRTRLSDHARRRARERDFTPADVRRVLAHGDPTQLPRGRTAWRGHGPQEGLVVITAPGGIVVTAWWSVR